MPKKDPRVDAYIAKCRPFAKPIMNYLRAVVHEGCPAAEETIKWGMPAFTHEGIIAIIASFKEHCAFVIWKGESVMPGQKRGAMGSLGKITSVADLPPRKTLVGYVKKRADLNEAGGKSKKPAATKPKTRKSVVVPAELKAGLAKNAKAKAVFDAFPPSHRREYCDWISGAKGADTKARRLKTALEWISAGKPHNWKYMKRKATA